MDDSFLHRSLVWAKPAPPRGIEFLCDCAMITEVQFDGEPVDGLEIAVTCEGCTSVHWFTFSVRESHG